MGRLDAELLLNSCFLDTVLVTLLRTAVESAISGVHKLLRIGGVPTSLINTVVLAVADGLFGLYGSERLEELFISTRSPPSPFTVPNKPYGFCGRKHNDYLLVFD